VLRLIGDSAPWHVRQEVRRFIRQHNRKVKHTGVGGLLLVCYLPIKSPWLNPIDPSRVHGQHWCKLT
jgi:transposase